MVSDPEEMVSLEMTETDPIVPEKRILSYYLLDTLSTNSSSIDSEHKHLLNFYKVIIQLALLFLHRIIFR